MAESNLPKQDFAPPWLKFPSTETVKTPNQVSYQNERNRQRREDPYHSRSEYNRLYRQTSFDFRDAKRYPQGQGKYRHHSIEDDYLNYSYGGYGYYAPNFSYEKFGLPYSSQPPLARSGNRDGKHTPGRFSQSSAKRVNTDKEQQQEKRDINGNGKERGGDRGKPFTEDFPSLKGSGENTPDAKQTKPGSGVWDNPPKSGRSEESPESLKNTPPGMYKALLLSKNGQTKKNGSEAARVNGRNSSPLGPSNKANHREATSSSPTPDLAIVTQPKKICDKKSEFLRTLRHETSQRNGLIYQSINQNSLDKTEATKEADKNVNDGASDYSYLCENENKSMDNSTRMLANDNKKPVCKIDKPLTRDCGVDGVAVSKHMDHIYLSGEDEEKRLLESMGWSEEDETEYVITDDDVKEFHHMLNRFREQGEFGNSSRHSVFRLKLKTHFASGLLNGTYHEVDQNGKH